MRAGLLEANRTRGTVKRVHCGWAAHRGVAAADLARHGLTSPPIVLERRFGFLRAFCGDRFTHAGVDAALRLRAHGLAPADVTAIELGVPSPSCARSPSHPRPRARPASGYHAAFSGPYTVTVALLGGGRGTPCPTRSWRGSSTTTP